jgi:hypothetical protein
MKAYFLMVWQMLFAYVKIISTTAEKLDFIPTIFYITDFHKVDFLLGIIIAAKDKC